MGPGQLFILSLLPHLSGEVVRFHASCPASSSASSSASSAGPQLQALDRSVPRRTRTASSGAVAGPRRTRTATSGPLGQSGSSGLQLQSLATRSQCSLPDPHSNLWIKVISAELQPRQALDRSVPRRARTASSECQIECHGRIDARQNARIDVRKNARIDTR